MPVQHGEGIAGAVSQGNHHILCRQLVTLAGVLLKDMQGLKLALIVVGHIDQALGKPNLATQSNDFCAQTLHHLDQFEGANVRMRSPQNFFGCAKAHKFIHHLATQVSGVFDLAVKLAV